MHSYPWILRIDLSPNDWLKHIFMHDKLIKLSKTWKMKCSVIRKQSRNKQRDKVSYFFRNKLSKNVCLCDLFGIKMIAISLYENYANIRDWSCINNYWNPWRTLVLKQKNATWKQFSTFVTIDAPQDPPFQTNDSSSKPDTLTF